MTRTPSDSWNDYQLAVILGVTGTALSRWRCGARYPEVRMLKKIEKIFGWPAAEQIDLIPSTGYNLTWSMKFNQVLNEWKEANPRVQASQDLRSMFPARSGRPAAPPE